MTYKGNRLMSELSNKSSIEDWRAAKVAIDKANDPASLLGCVGEPLALWLEDYIDLDRYSADCNRALVAACAEARGNLLDMVNDHRQQVADEVQGELYSTLEYLDGSDIESELDLDVAASIGLVDDELAELADRLFDFPTQDGDDDDDAE